MSAKAAVHRRVEAVAAAIAAAVGIAALGYCAGSQAEPIVEKIESWGPCPTPESICRQTTQLFESGKVILQGKENKTSQLSLADVEKVITFIRSSELLQKDCTANPNSIADYGATYRIRLDGKERTITFPGCERDLSRLSELMQP